MEFIFGLLILIILGAFCLRIGKWLLKMIRRLTKEIQKKEPETPDSELPAIISDKLLLVSMIDLFYPSGKQCPNIPVYIIPDEVIKSELKNANKYMVSAKTFTADLTRAFQNHLDNPSRTAAAVPGRERTERGLGEDEVPL